MQTFAIVVFGAAVRPDGSPSPALARRIAYAARAARADPGAPLLCSGAAARGAPSEASVIAAELAGRHGVSASRLSLDEASVDTLQSVLAAARFVRSLGLAGCVACSDRYHIPRIRLLLGALGIATRAGPLARGRAGTPARVWIYMHLREALAIPYDLALVLARRRGVLRAIAAETGPDSA